MLNFVRAIRCAAVAAVAAAVLVTATLPSKAETGSVRFRVTKAGFILGVGGGTGVLHFRGKNYPLRVSGISAGTIGVAQADLVGTAHNLRTATDIAGTYTAGSASVAVAGGAKVARLQNANGVVLELHGAQAGFELSLNLGGATVTMGQ
jgi:lipid-binding SYLF domain-containing protein